MKIAAEYRAVTTLLWWKYHSLLFLLIEELTYFQVFDISRQRFHIILSGSKFSLGNSSSNAFRPYASRGEENIVLREGDNVRNWDVSKYLHQCCRNILKLRLTVHVVYYMNKDNNTHGGPVYQIISVLRNVEFQYAKLSARNLGGLLASTKIYFNMECVLSIDCIIFFYMYK